MPVLTTTGLTERERRAVDAFARRVRERFGSRISRIILYGSKTRGEATADSDIDVLVLMDLDDRRVSDAICEEVTSVGLETGVFVSIVTDSVAHFETSRCQGEPFARSVTADGVPL